MIINSPGMITSRLCAGVKIGDVTISIEYANCGGRGGRTRYRYFLDSSGGVNEYSADDLQSGCQGGGLQDGLESLLSFLGAAGEAYEFEKRTGCASDNTDLFPAWVNEWAYQNSDEIGMLLYEMEEGETVLIEG